MLAFLSISRASNDPPFEILSRKDYKFNDKQELLGTKKANEWIVGFYLFQSILRYLGAYLQFMESTRPLR